MDSKWLSFRHRFSGEGEIFRQPRGKPQETPSILSKCDLLRAPASSLQHERDQRESVLCIGGEKEGGVLRCVLYDVAYWEGKKHIFFKEAKITPLCMLLYEARYLALLEESMLKKKFFVHFVLDPISISNSATEASFSATHGCLVSIENVEKLDVGALVSIRGIGRVKIINFVQVEPYLKGEVRPMKDRVSDSAFDINPKVMEVKEALSSLNSLEIKLKAPKEAELQTSILNSLSWAEKEPSLECDEAFIPSSVERVSFAAFQPVTGSTQSEQAKLQAEKVKAMELKDTVLRLENSLELVKDNISMLAAKLAIQSLGMK